MQFESPFQSRISDARARAAELRERLSGDAAAGDPLSNALEELTAALEELEVSDEELRAQNESLAASQLMLETERQRYADLFHLAPEPYLVTGPDGTIRESNRAASELLGVVERGLAGKPLAVFVAGGELRAFREKVNRAAAGARVNDFEVTLTPRRGEPVRVSCTVQPAARLLPGGQALRWILRDVTERRRAEEAERLLAAEHAARCVAERAEQRLSQVLEATSDAFFSLDAEGRFTYVNERAAALWGRGRDELLGRPAAEVFPTPDDWAVADAPALALAEGRPVRAEAWSPLARRWVEVNAFPTHDGIAVFFRDVEDRHRRAAAERLLAQVGEALSASLDGDEMLRRVAEVAAEAVGGWCVVRVGTPGAQAACAAAHRDPARSPDLQALLHAQPFDPAGAHPVARAMRTGEPSLLEGSEPTIAAAFPDPAQREQVRAMGAASGVVVPLQARGRTLGALILVRGADQPAFDGDDLALAGEVARRTAMGVDNARLYRDSRAATRAREEVLAVVSHDLRNPLNAVLLASVILDEYGDPDRLGERERLQVRTIRNSAEQMASLIHDLVEVVALEAGTRVLQRDHVQPAKAMRTAA
ncbi:MAG TPA: PAS domain S-box protein, partial [Longimicrobium sp.]|nr:PAS domain S-box protein [Longimicrobium sp.]